MPAVTLPENEEADFGDFEQTRNVPKFPNFMDFQQTYISMVTKPFPCASEIRLGVYFSFYVSILICGFFQLNKLKGYKKKFLGSFIVHRRIIWRK